MATNTRSDLLPSHKPLTFLRLPQVKRRVALSRSELYRKIKAAEFPAPVKLSKHASAWAEHEVEAWCLARLAARRTGELPEPEL